MPGPFADDQLAAYVAQVPPAPAEPAVATLREANASRARARSRGPEMLTVRDLLIGELPARLYRPVAGPIPVVVYLHGGGWTIGSLESHDKVCRRLAAGSGAAILAIDYRLAPEHPWPASVDDAVAALRWVSSGPDELGATPTVVAVAGDSAGGTLATLACLRLRDESSTALPALQVLLYANADLAGTCPSIREKAQGWGLDVAMVRFYNAQWVPDQARWKDPGISPLYAPDLTGLPPALIVTAEHDPLRDECEAYAGRLRDAGVAVEHRREPGLIHGFMMLDEVSPACSAAVDRIADGLRAHLTVA